MTDADRLSEAVSALNLEGVHTLLSEGVDPNSIRSPGGEASCQPDQPLKMVMFRLSDCVLEQVGRDQLALIATLLLEHGADPVPALNIAEKRYGPYKGAGDEDTWEAWHVIAAAAEISSGGSTMAAELPFSVGSVVRVFGESVTKATVSCINVEDGTVDIILFATQEEIDGLALESVKPLEQFELQDPGGDEDLLSKLDRKKGEGNLLFKLKDFAAALAHYKGAIAVLQKSMSVGDSVVVRAAAGFRPATVADMDTGAKTIDVFFSDGDEEDLDGLPVAKAVMVKPSVPAMHAVEVALYMNMARCGLQTKAHSFVVLYCTVLLALLNCECEMSEEGWASKNLGKAYQLRAQAHLNQQHWKKSQKDVDAALQLDPGCKQSQKIGRTITKKMDASLKADRKLAKEVGKWVQKSMSKESEADAGARAGKEGSHW
jgi:tetratricopeptide (TPR) repeat protein